MERFRALFRPGGERFLVRPTAMPARVTADRVENRGRGCIKRRVEDAKKGKRKRDILQPEDNRILHSRLGRLRRALSYFLRSPSTRRPHPSPLSFLRAFSTSRFFQPPRNRVFRGVRRGHYVQLQEAFSRSNSVYREF